MAKIDEIDREIARLQREKKEEQQRQTEQKLHETVRSLAAAESSSVYDIVAMALAKWKSSRPGETQDVINIITGEGVPQEAVDDFAERLNEELGRLSG